VYLDGATYRPRRHRLRRVARGIFAASLALVLAAALAWLLGTHFEIVPFAIDARGHRREVAVASTITGELVHAIGFAYLRGAVLVDFVPLPPPPATPAPRPAAPVIDGGPYR